jgi:hypothetical protein
MAVLAGDQVLAVCNGASLPQQIVDVFREESVR